MDYIGIHEIILLFIIATILGLAVGVIPFWFICKRAGLSPWLSLIMMIPLGAIVLPYILAFIEWPVLRSGRSFATQGSLP